MCSLTNKPLDGYVMNAPLLAFLLKEQGNYQARAIRRAFKNAGWKPAKADQIITKGKVDKIIKELDAPRWKINNRWLALRKRKHGHRHLFPYSRKGREILGMEVKKMGRPKGLKDPQSYTAAPILRGEVTIISKKELKELKATARELRKLKREIARLSK
jgi:hypothetical protein